MIAITATAAQQILESRSETQADAPGLCLRVAAKRLADGSFDYAMGWDEQGQHDTRSQSNGIAIIIAPTCIEFLQDATLDYVEMEQGKYRFIFMNPNDPTFVPPKKDQ